MSEYENTEYSDSNDSSDSGNESLYEGESGSAADSPIYEEDESDADSSLYEEEESAADSPIYEEEESEVESSDSEEESTDAEEVPTEAEEESTEAEETPERRHLSPEERADLQEKTGWSDEILDHISSPEEAEIYIEAGLKEEVVDGRTCLVRSDLDLDYIPPGMSETNRELMARGNAPYDAKTGEQIELHHIGQEYDSPLAELTEGSEHGDYSGTLHTTKIDSWRQDAKKNNHYNNTQRPHHWQARERKGREEQ